MMRVVRMTKWFRFWSIWFAIGLHSPNHANHGKPITKVWIVLPPDAGAGKVLFHVGAAATVALDGEQLVNSSQQVALDREPHDHSS